MKNKTIARAAAILLIASSASFSASANMCEFLGVTEMPFFCPAP